MRTPSRVARPRRARAAGLSDSAERFRSPIRHGLTHRPELRLLRARARHHDPDSRQSHFGGSKARDEYSEGEGYFRIEAVGGFNENVSMRRGPRLELNYPPL
jgi:hypothetical protein